MVSSKILRTFAIGMASISTAGAQLVIDNPTFSILTAFGYDGNNPLVLRNTGADPLPWSFSGVRGGATWFDSVRDELFKDRFSPQYLAVRSLNPLRAPMSLDTVGSDGVIDASDDSRYYGAEGGNRIMIDGVPSTTISGDGRLAMLAHFDLFVLGAVLDGQSSIGTSGTLNAIAGRTASASSFDVTHGGVEYHCFLKSVYGGGAGVAVLNHLWITDSDTVPTHTFDADSSSDVDTLSGLAPDAQVFLLVFATASDGPRPVADFEPMVREIAKTAQPTTFVAEPSSGTLAPGETVTVTLTALSPILPPREEGYPHLLDFAAGDPLQTAASISANLRIDDLTDVVSVSEPQLTVGMVSGLAPSLPPLELTGTTALPNLSPRWTVSSTVPWLSADPPSGVVPGEFTPVIDQAQVPAGAASGTLLIDVGPGDPIEVPVDLNPLDARFDKIIAQPGVDHVYAIQRGGSSPGDAQALRLDPLTGDVLSLAQLRQRADDITLDPTTDLLFVSDPSVGETAVFPLADWPVRRAPKFDRFGEFAGAMSGQVVFGSTDSRIASIRDSFTSTSSGSVFLDAGNQVRGLTTMPLVNRAVVGGGGVGAGRQIILYRLDIGPSIDRTLLTEVDPASPLIASAGGERILWGNQVFDSKLNLLGTLSEAAIATSPRGELVVTQTGVLRLSSGGTRILELPFPTSAAAIWGDAERLIAHNATTGQTVSLPLRDYSANAADFGDVALGTTATTSVTVTNHGVEPLTLTGATNGSISLSTFPTTIPPGSSAQLTATFTPTVLGLFEGEATLTDGFIEGPTRSVAFTATGSFDPATLPGYATWSAGDTTLTDPLADPDSDGFPNYAEFLFDLDPSAPGDPLSHLPAITSAGQLSYVRRTALADQVTLQRTPDLEVWTNAPPFAQNSTDLGNGTERVVITIPTGGDFYRATARLVPGG